MSTPADPNRSTRLYRAASPVGEEDIHPGAVIGEGRFKIFGLIGRGKMASVFRARDLRRNTDVALKVLARKYVGHHDQERRFDNEARLGNNAAAARAQTGVIRIKGAEVAPDDHILHARLMIAAAGGAAAGADRAGGRVARSRRPADGLCLSWPLRAGAAGMCPHPSGPAAAPCGGCGDS